MQRVPLIAALLATSLLLITAGPLPFNQRRASDKDKPDKEKDTTVPKILASAEFGVTNTVLPGSYVSDTTSTYYTVDLRLNNFVGTASPQCVYVCFKAASKFEFADVWEKNSKPGDNGNITGVLVSNARPSNNTYSSLLEIPAGSGSGVYRFGKKEGPKNVNPGDVSATFTAADLSKTIFTACTQLPGGGMQINLHHENVTQPGQNVLQYLYSSNLPAMMDACGINVIREVE